MTKLDVASEVFTTASNAAAWQTEEDEDLPPAIAVAREVQAVIEADPSLELAAAARRLARATRTLQRQLRAEATSFRAVRSAVRVELARRLLLHSDAKVTSIALDVGCASLQHFVRLFRAQVGVTPRAFRRLSDAAASVASPSAP